MQPVSFTVTFGPDGQLLVPPPDETDELRQRYEKLFNPDEPRDEHGKWAVGVNNHEPITPGPQPLMGQPASPADEAWLASAARMAPSGRNRTSEAAAFAAQNPKLNAHDAQQLLEEFTKLQYPDIGVKASVAALNVAARALYGGQLPADIRADVEYFKNAPYGGRARWNQAVEQAKLLLPILAKASQENLRGIPGLINSDGTVTLYRGVFVPPGQPDPYALQDNEWHAVAAGQSPLKSWTISPDHAEAYGQNAGRVHRASEGQGYLVSARVPIARVAASALAGMGLPEVGEVVVAGGSPMNVLVRRVSTTPRVVTTMQPFDKGYDPAEPRDQRGRWTSGRWVTEGSMRSPRGVTWTLHQSTRSMSEGAISGIHGHLESSVEGVPQVYGGGKITCSDGSSFAFYDSTSASIVQAVVDMGHEMKATQDAIANLRNKTPTQDDIIEIEEHLDNAASCVGAFTEGAFSQTSSVGSDMVGYEHERDLSISNGFDFFAGGDTSIDLVGPLQRALDHLNAPHSVMLEAITTCAQLQKRPGVQIKSVQ